MEKLLKIGVIQAIVDSHLAWADSPQMDAYEANAIWRQIQAAFASFQEMSETNKPDIVVIPELAVATYFESRIKSYAQKIGAIVIAGLDFKQYENDKVANKAVFYVPRDWPHEKNVGKVKSTSFYFGKHFASREEIRIISEKWKKSFSPCNEFYIVDLAGYGKLGVSICADFYDIERYAIYKGRIQHLLIIANNKDIKSFYFLAEAISRLVFCNVVICNSGHYGGSVCFTPAKHEFERYSYKHEGHDLFTTQIVSLPVDALWKAQSENEDALKGFKNPPPGYEYHYDKYVKQDKEEKK